MILDYKDLEFHMIIERLHINKEIDEYGDKIYEIIKNSNFMTIGFLNKVKNLKKEFTLYMTTTTDFRK